MEKLQQWQKIKEIVGSALERPLGERSAYLDEVCSQDWALRAEVESLLAAHQGAEGLSDITWSITALPTQEIPQARFVPGAVLAKRYRIVTPVGQGGMGELYRAEDLRLGQTVALKFLPKTVAHVPAAWAQVEREVRIARQISHPNVCRVFDIAESNDGPFITMEFIDGEDLASLLKRIGRLHTDKGLQVAHQLCTGLAAAHELGIVHRDLKPANIMVDGRGRVRITDFGLAALVQELRKDQIRAGTPGYMAPEQVTGGQVTPRTDIYAAGLVMYELFSGHRAFPLTKAFDRHRPSPVRVSSIIKGFDPVIERIISHCLAPNPEERPTSASEVAAALPVGDPLRAAVEAGETPSPDTVAAAGGSVAMSAGASFGLLAAVLLCLFASVGLGRYATWLNAIHGGKPPEVLVDRAREVITRLGYDENAADTAGWMEMNPSGLTHLSRGSPDSVLFVYRQSPRPMNPRELYSDVDTNDPAMDVPGMITVVLDARGRLREFIAVPATVAGQGVAVPDWAALLLEAGFLSARVSTKDGTVVPPTAFDVRQDWQASESGQTTSITAAAYNGKLVYFRAAPPGVTAKVDTAGTGTVGDIMFVFAAAFCGIGGWFLARRNMRRGRGDRQGAFRVAIFIFTGEFVSWALAAHFSRDAWRDYWEFVGGCGAALYMAGFMWVLYMAIEPYMRRRWPEMLISWARVLTGKVYDPRVGRDVMLGALGGAAMAIIQNAVNALPAWFQVANIQPARTSQLTLRGPAGVISALSYDANLAVQWALATGAFLVVARFIMRRDWPAVVLSAISLGLVVLAADNLLIAVPAVLLCAAIVYSLLFRYGLLSVAVTLFFYFILRRFPLTFDFSQWFVWRSICSIVVLAAMAIYAWLAMNVGRPIFAESDDEG
jgi:protein kinase-like protein